VTVPDEESAYRTSDVPKKDKGSGVFAGRRNDDEETDELSR
jgi:hypothetical protein